MEGGDVSRGGAKRHPKAILALFCAISFMVYLDRGMIASNGVNGSRGTPLDPDGSGISGHFGLTFFQSGLLPATFLGGLLVAAPIFAEASKHYNGFRLIGTGLSIWTAAIVGCAFCWSFNALVAFRSTVGVGEASFVALAQPYIDDAAPKGKRTEWLAFFYLTIPVGVAAGYIFGGVAGTLLGWRAAFLLEAVLMAPFVVFCLTTRPLPLKGGVEDFPDEFQLPEGPSDDEEDTDVILGGGVEDEEAALLPGTPEAAASPSPAPTPSPRRSSAVLPAAAAAQGGWWRQAKRRARRPLRWARVGYRKTKSTLASFSKDVGRTLSFPVYGITVAAVTCWTAVLGVYAYWGPHAGKELFHMARPEGDVLFGGVTVLTGVFGTVLGGVMLDRLGASMRTALLTSAYGSAAAALVLVPTFLFTRSLKTFIPMLMLGELCLFVSQAPASAVMLWAVPKRLRPFSVSLTTITIHVLGDVPSPPLVGALQGKLEDWRVTMALLSAILLASALCFALGAQRALSAPDFRDQDPTDARRSSEDATLHD